MRKRNWLYTSSLLALASCAGKDAMEYPNVVFILADDLGYGDIASLNEEGKIHTPNVDRLVEEGVNFTDAHSSAAVSTPSRYGILTGRYNWRSTLKGHVLGTYHSPIIPEGRMTMPMMFKTCGYETACFGKWHLGMNFPTAEGAKAIDKPDSYTLDFSKEITGGPVDRGFDHYFGVDCPNYPPYCFIEDRNTVGIPSVYYEETPDFDCTPGRGVSDWKLDQVLPSIISEAEDYMTRKVTEGKRFFVYLPLTSPHTPIVPTKEFEGKSGMNLYADFVMQTDNAVGRILDKLDDLGVAENTIVVFTSDNGCSPRARFTELAEFGHNPNYIFRGSKTDLYEGGHHIPCVVRWTARIKPHTVRQTICQTDFYRTFASIIGYDVKDNEAEDSYDLSPLLFSNKEKTVLREATVHHSHYGSFAIRKGDWKLLMDPGSGGWTKPDPNAVSDADGVQLYNLKEDPREKNDLSLVHPEVVESMRTLLIKYIEDGRSTPGARQENDGPRIWKEIEWVEECRDPGLE